MVVDDTTIAFGEIRSPGTMSNIGHNPEVEVNFVDSFTRKGYRVRGLARVVRKGTAEYDRLSPQWVDLWGNLAARMNAVVVIDITAAKPLSTPPYDDGATEEQMIALYKAKYAGVYP